MLPSNEEREVLNQILAEHSSAYLLNIPSVQDALAEYFSEDIKDRLEDRKSPKYNHMFALAFSIDTDFDADESHKIPSSELRAAIERRMDNLDASGDLEWAEAIGLPLDTYENAEFEENDDGGDN